MPPRTTLEALKVWAPRCTQCGDLATSRLKSREILIKWEFTNGFLIYTEFLPEREILEERARRWAQELRDLGLPSDVTWKWVPTTEFYWYYCEEHRRPSSEDLPYRDLIVLKGDETNHTLHPNRFERDIL